MTIRELLQISIRTSLEVAKKYGGLRNKEKKGISEGVFRVSYIRNPSYENNLQLVDESSDSETNIVRDRNSQNAFFEERRGASFHTDACIVQPELGWKIHGSVPNEDDYTS